ncbi:Bifunctional PGK/TIM [Pirellulimonas nuda]|uniref:Phosphoglycerate kinase n=1 Tax=Pirellulimonas nuda TaxID=2528009 RepID=A0A518DIS9_9BACT|nr:phosphoglycerate kinase [Pirellulimonas nuda]QDU91380.1 Bifunctional PGK/TIM [Pirellulimonas nuda]
MPVDPQSMLPWLETIVTGGNAEPPRALGDYLDAIPRLDSLADLPKGTAVLVRGDVDAKPGDKVGKGDIRLRSMVETLQYGHDRGWVQVVFGHIGRDPQQSLDKVAARLGGLMGADVPLIKGWYDEQTNTVTELAASRVADAAPGSILMLENTRAYDIERVLWKAKPADLPAIAEKLADFANEVAGKIAKVYVNEALSAGSLDASSTVVPAAMDRVALGKYVASEFEGPMKKCLQTQLVVFSGLKIDKLDDLEAMIARGTIKQVFAAGSLAMALRKAIGELDGKDVSIGVAEDPSHSDKPYYIPRERVEQAKQMVAEGRKKGIEFVVPVDSVIEDGSVKEALEASDQQFDIGPKSSALFEQKVTEFIEAGAKGAVAFHNGVFGMFEDPRFEAGTRNFIPQLKRMTDAGALVYVGGGEGGKALEKYGSESDVTHVFTAGGTVLNALGSEPVPYLVALAMAAK